MDIVFIDSSGPLNPPVEKVGLGFSHPVGHFSTAI